MINDNLRQLYRYFYSAGFALRVVGGAVRDHLLGKEPKDIDLCTDATPDEMIVICTRRNLRFIPTGLKHGTISIFIDNVMYEVTTLRIDVETDGRHAEVQFTRYFKEDAERRDFTINAMSMDMAGNVYDYFDGKADLKYGLIRFVGDPDKRIKEDYLRILRAFRFASQLNFYIEYDSIEAIGPNIKGLNNISAERKWQEMQKLLFGQDANFVLKQMNKSYVLLIGLGLVYNSSVIYADDAITALWCLETKRNPDEVQKKWALSSKERDKFAYFEHQDNREEDVLHQLVLGVPRDHIISWCKLNSLDGMADYAASCDIPIFPVSGKDLLAKGMEPGYHIGDILRGMKIKWAESNYALTKESLLKGY